MRIVVAHYHRTLVGGIETYLAAVLPRLAAQGHELLFAHESAPETGHAPIPLPAGVEAVGLDCGIDSAIGRIVDWKPDLAFVHALHVPEFQRAIVARFPTALFAHGYYGLCISGSKTWRHPAPVACEKRFDWTCLLHYHAKGCGGSSPVTMVRNYFLHRRQLDVLKTCGAILTHGGRMQREYIAEGISEERVFALPHFVETTTIAARSARAESSPRDDFHQNARLLYAGRFDDLKGGLILLEALPLIAEKLGRRIELEMVGAGPAANSWKRLADTIRSEKISVNFRGWLDRAALDERMRASDLLIVPSVWPEPFGQVGLEAAQIGLPAVAFNVGGIPTWLRDGVNGHLAVANPPTKTGLAEAVAKALGNLNHYATMRAGTLAVAKEFTVEKHLAALNQVFEKVARSR
jgi:glycosyltransferase involved in cell wall biosynthesis